MRNIPIPKTPKQFPRILSQKQVTQLLNPLKERVGTWYGFRNLVMTMTFLEMGLRRQELIDAKIDDLDLEGKTLKVHGKGAKDRRVFFGGKMKILLRKWLRIRENISAPVEVDNIFIGTNGKPLKARNINNIYSRIKKRAGLHGVQVSPHVFRHTSATMAVENGMDEFSLRSQFGWSDIKTALRYVHMTGKRLGQTFRESSPMDHFDLANNEKNDRDDEGKWVSR